jgi:hypothetical protein
MQEREQPLNRRAASGFALTEVLTALPVLAALMRGRTDWGDYFDEMDRGLPVAPPDGVVDEEG